MLIDDSATGRQINKETFDKAAASEVNGGTADPLYALERMKRNGPDVLVVNIAIPHMDGLTFLKKIMAEHPTPTIIGSSLVAQGAAVRRITSDAWCRR